VTAFAQRNHAHLRTQRGFGAGFACAADDGRKMGAPALVGANTVADAICGLSRGSVFLRAVDNRLVAGSGVQRSVEVEEAAWIGDCLSPFESGVLTSVVPSGFEAYVRVLHPLDAQAHGQQPGRWIEVASWSGVELVPGIDFPDIALPEHEPSGAEPWPGEVPQVGTLHPVYADALAAVLARHTSTPDRCWFCTWEGWGSVGFDDGPRVELPGRNYVLFVGPLGALPCLMDAQDDHSPNLWWPDDRAWCVATEIDLAWTYVGGSAALISDVLANPRLEAQPASPKENHHRQPPQWLAPVIEDAVTALLDSGTATLHTWRGTVHAQLRQPHGRTDGDLRIERRACNAFAGSSWSLITEHDPVRLRHNLTTALTSAVIELL
jgi:hypothetical protein